MAIALDTTSTQTLGVSVAGPMTWTHTCTGSGLALFVMITTQSVSNAGASGVTYNGVAMTLVDIQGNTNPNIQTQLWYLASPATGANTISASWAFTPGRAGGIGMSLTGCSATPAGVSGKSSGADTTPTVSITTTNANAWVVNAMEVGNDPEFGTSTGTNQTDRQQVTPFNNFDLQISTQTTTTAGSYTQSYSKSGSSQWATISLEVIPSASAGGAAATMPTLLLMNVG